MRAVGLVTLGAIGGLALGVVLGGGARPSAVPTGATRGEARGNDATDAREITERLRRIEQQIERLAATVDGAGRSVSSPAVQGAAEPRGGAAPAPANAAPQPVADGALRSMTDAELRSEAQRLLRAKDAAAARRALEHLLARPLGVDDRARALASLGSVHLRTGDDVAAEASLQQAVDVLGVAGDEGAWATYELGLLASRREDFAQALRLGEQVARAEGVSVWNRRHGRWLAATMREAMGDVDAARREYRAMLAECGDDPQFGWLVRDLTARLP